MNEYRTFESSCPNLLPPQVIKHAIEGASHPKQNGTVARRPYQAIHGPTEEIWQNEECDVEILLDYLRRFIRSDSSSFFSGCQYRASVSISTILSFSSSIRIALRFADIAPAKNGRIPMHSFRI